MGFFRSGKIEMSEIVTSEKKEKQVDNPENLQ